MIRRLTFVLHLYIEKVGRWMKMSKGLYISYPVYQQSDFLTGES